MELRFGLSNPFSSILFSGLFFNSVLISDSIKMSVAFRSIAPFMRTARRGLQGRNINPLQAALKKQTAASLISAQRTYATFTRDKPHVNIGTIGHVDHGKVRWIFLCF